MGNIKARRLLSDLFKEGVEVRFWKGEDGKPVGKIGPFLDEKTGRPVKAKDTEVSMWVQPPDPVQRDMAIRAAQGRRASALVKAKRDLESEEHLTIMAFLADMSDEVLIDYVIVSDTPERRAEAEREVLGRDDWKDMTSYQDVMRQFLERAVEGEDLEDDEEYLAMMELDQKYADEVSERERELTEAQREALSFLPREVVEKKALDKRAEIVGSQAFMAEYERQMLFYSVRDPDTIDKLFFETVVEMSAQPDQVRELIEEALLPYIGDSGDAKNSQRAASGLDSSALPEAPETSDSSTPEEQIA